MTMTDQQFETETRTRQMESEARAEAERTKQQVERTRQAELELALAQLRADERRPDPARDLQQAKAQADFAAAQAKQEALAKTWEDDRAKFREDREHIRARVFKEIVHETFKIFGSGIKAMVDSRVARLNAVDEKEYAIIAKIAEKDEDKGAYALAVKRLADRDPFRE